MSQPWTAGDSALERRHRQRVVLALAVLIALALAPLAGHHTGDVLNPLLEGRDHLGTVCMIALHVLLAPVHGAFHVLLAAGLAYGASDRARALWRANRLFRSLSPRRVEAGSLFERAAIEARLDPAIVRVVPSLPNPAFTAGLMRPLVYVSASLANTLTFEQLVAVFAHEGAHARRYDPLRLSALRFIALSLFWLPALRHLADDLADEAEIAADDAAAGQKPLVLASALLAMASASRASLAIGEAGLHGSRSAMLLERRVRRLAGETVPAATRLTNRSILVAATVLVVAWLSGTTVLHPLPEAHRSMAHCAHEDGPLSHLFCRRSADAHDVHAHHAVDCPHRAV